MKWKWIRCAILGLFLTANIGLFALLQIQEQGAGQITREEWETAQEIYEKNGIRWSLDDSTIPYYPARILTLKSVDMRTNASTALGEDVTEIYLSDVRTRYLKDGDVVLVSSENSSMEYYRSSLREDSTDTLVSEAAAETFGEAFARVYSPFEIEVELHASRVEEKERVLTYYQRWKGELLLFNQVQLMIDGVGVRRGEITYYSIQSSTRDTAMEYPLDELLYQCLRQLEIGAEDGEKKPKALTQIEYAYRLEKQDDGTIQGIPCVYFVFDDQETYVIDRIIR